jgi:capsular polysaccharide biosynthesis protein
VPVLPSSPKPLLYTLAAVVVGLAIGIFAAFLREFSDHRIRSGRDIELAVGLPLLADFLAPSRRSLGKLSRARVPAAFRALPK